MEKLTTAELIGIGAAIGAVGMSLTLAAMLYALCFAHWWKHELTPALKLWKDQSNTAKDKANNEGDKP